MARAPKKSAAEAEPAAVDAIERRLWVLEQAATTQTRVAVVDRVICCGVCHKPLADVFDGGCGIIDQTTAIADACPHKEA